MRHVKRILSAAILCSVGLHSAANAGLNLEHIAASARWIVHADPAAFRRTELGRHVHNRMNAPEADRKFKAFKAMFQFDPREDLDAVTLYGMGEGNKDGVALIQGRLNTDQLVALVRGNEHYSSTVHGTRVIHSWIDDKEPGKRKYGSVVRNDLVVVGDNETLVKLAVDVLEGRATNMLSAPRSLPGLEDAEGSTFFIGSADMTDMPDMNPKAAILRQSEAVSLALTESDGTLKGVLRMVARDSQTAQAVHSIAQGLVSLTILNTQEKPQLAKLAQSLEINLNGDEVHILLDYPVADAINCMKACEAHKEAVQAE